MRIRTKGEAHHTKGSELGLSSITEGLGADSSLGAMARVPDAVDVNRVGEFGFLTSCQVKWMLLAQDHILGNTILLQYLERLKEKKIAVMTSYG